MHIRTVQPYFCVRVYISIDYNLKRSWLAHVDIKDEIHLCANTWLTFDIDEHFSLLVNELNRWRLNLGGVAAGGGLGNAESYFYCNIFIDIRCPLCNKICYKSLTTISTLHHWRSNTLSFLFSLLAPVWLWTLRWWEKPTVWSQTCWQTPPCPRIPAAPWRPSETCSAPRSTCNRCTGLVSPRTPTPAPTLRRGLKERSGWPFPRYMLQIIHCLQNLTFFFCFGFQPSQECSYILYYILV